jgi:hypothetical protein
MDTSFLNRLVRVLKMGKSAPCQRAIDRLLLHVTKRYENGEIETAAAAEAVLREMVNKELICASWLAKKRIESSTTLRHRN